MLQPTNEYFSLDDVATEAQYIPGVPSAIALNFQVPGVTEIPLRNGAADNIELAAKWTQAEESSIKHIYLRLRRLGTIAAGKIVKLRIVSDSAGLPGVAILAISDPVAADTMSTAFNWVRFTLVREIWLDADTTYHAILSGDYDASSGNHIRWRSSTVASGGNQEIYDTSWAAVVTENFEIYAAIPVIFDAPYTQSTIGDTTVQNLVPAATCRTADITDAQNDMQLIIGGITYNIHDIQPDGTGITKVFLGLD